MASTEAIALIAAGGTAVGALIGSTSGRIIDFWLVRARERRNARTAARLIRGDLEWCVAVLDGLHEGRTELKDVSLPTEGWDAYKDQLTAHLTDAELRAVIHTIANIRFVGHRIHDIAARGAAVSEDSAEGWTEFKPELEHGIRVLGRVAA